MTFGWRKSWNLASFRPNAANDFFELLVNREMGQMSTRTICEHKALLVLPGRTGAKPRFCLFDLLPLQRRHHGGSNGNQADLAVLRGNQLAFFAHLLTLLELLVNVKRTALEVNAIPGKAQNLPLTHTSEQSDQEQQFILVPSNRFKELGDFLLFQGSDFFLVDLRQVTGIGGVMANRTNLNSRI